MVEKVEVSMVLTGDSSKLLPKGAVKEIDSVKGANERCKYFVCGLRRSTGKTQDQRFIYFVD